MGIRDFFKKNYLKKSDWPKLLKASRLTQTLHAGQPERGSDLLPQATLQHLIKSQAVTMATATRLQMALGCLAIIHTKTTEPVQPYCTGLFLKLNTYQFTEISHLTWITDQCLKSSGGKVLSNNWYIITDMTLKSNIRWTDPRENWEN